MSRDKKAFTPPEELLAGVLYPKEIRITWELFKSICDSYRDFVNIEFDPEYDSEPEVTNYQEIKNLIFDKIENIYRDMLLDSKIIHPNSFITCYVDDAFNFEKGDIDNWIDYYFYEDEDTKVLNLGDMNQPNTFFEKPTAEASYSYSDIDELIKEATIKSIEQLNGYLSQTGYILQQAEDGFHYKTLDIANPETPELPYDFVSTDTINNLQSVDYLIEDLNNRLQEAKQSA